MEAHVVHLPQHLHGVLEAVFREFVIALPVHVEPSGVEVDDVRRNLVFPELSRHLKSFILREIGNAAHPCSESPKRQHGRLARQVGVFVENVLGFAKEDEEINFLVAHKQSVGTDIAGSEVAGDRCRGVHENAIALVGKEERHRLILTVGFGSLRVGDKEVDLLPHFVERCERLSTTVNPLTGRQ